MEIKYTLQAALVYSVFLLYVFSLICALLKSDKSARIVFALSFAASLMAFCFRWLRVAHLPMQSMFEVFITLSIFIFPISMLARKKLGQKGILSDCIIGAVILFPAAFIFDQGVSNLPEILKSPYFGPHVLSYLLAYILMAKAAVAAIAQLFGMRRELKLQADNSSLSQGLLLMGFPFLCLGMVLGSVWAQSAWGRFWGWDPKEMMALATLLFYAAYFLIDIADEKMKVVLCSLFSIVGFVIILLTFLFINLAKNVDSLHNYSG